MLVDDFIDIDLIHVGVPHPLRVDGDHRPLVSALHAARVIDAAQSGRGKFKRFDALFCVIAHGLSAFVGATGATVVALIDAKENVVAVVRTHERR